MIKLDGGLNTLYNPSNYRINIKINVRQKIKEG